MKRKIMFTLESKMAPHELEAMLSAMAWVIHGSLAQEHQNVDVKVTMKAGADGIRYGLEANGYDTRTRADPPVTGPTTD